MSVLLLLPAVLSLLVLVAHFMRSGNLLLVAVSVAAIVLLLLRRPWVARAVQVVLALAAIEWIATTLGLIDDRQAQGEPWMRAAAILFSVAAFNVFAAGLFQTPRLRRRYRLDPPESPQPVATKTSAPDA